jgi:tungstate transport system permease protein
MSFFLQGLARAFELLVSGDREVLEIAARTLAVSGAATGISLALGVPLGAAIALIRFPGRRLLMTAANTGMGLPPVTVGLVVTLLLWRAGPLGRMELLYTPAAIVLAQILIALPLVVGITIAALAALPGELILQLRGLGASRLQLAALLLREARVLLVAAAAAGFGSVISEVGASMMVGGNIRGLTRVLTTATVLETQRGNFELALAFSILLLAIVFAINAALLALQRAGARR